MVYEEPCTRSCTACMLCADGSLASVAFEEEESRDRTATPIVYTNLADAFRIASQYCRLANNTMFN